MYWTDSHAHLSDIDEDALSEVLGRAFVAGVAAIVNTATGLESAAIVRNQLIGRPMLKAAAAVSPFDLDSLPSDWDKQLIALLETGDFSAIGEFGLDSTNPSYPPRSAQMPIFRRQLEIARDLDLAAILHSRGSESEVLDAVIDAKLRRAVFHCYTGSAETAKRIVDAGYIVSISGIATFKSGPLDEVIAACPVSSILLETDAPYLAPVPHRGKTNEPAWVLETARAVADKKGISMEDLAGAVSDTFKGIFEV